MSRMTTRGVPVAKGRKGKGRRRAKGQADVTPPAKSTYTRGQLNNMAQKLIKRGLAGPWILDAEDAAGFMANPANRGRYGEPGWPRGDRHVMPGAKRQNAQRERRARGDLPKAA